MVEAVAGAANAKWFMGVRTGFFSWLRCWGQGHGLHSGLEYMVFKAGLILSQGAGNPQRLHLDSV